MEKNTSASPYRLSELNGLVKETLKTTFDEPVWLCAEISEMHESNTGHCYLELIEKDAKSDALVAKISATIWSFTYRMLKPYFESTTGTQLSAGMKILVAANIEFHEVYGISLNIRDLDPTYTMGDMAQRRAKIIQQLTDEGIIDMNKLLEMPAVPQRVAIVSSASAAGYGDFCNQLDENAWGYKFYARLFAATMQGNTAEQSVINALDHIAEQSDKFDVVVIIRGGGATSDLSAFDSYNIAMHCAQFPLPIISGIGHQRDDSVVDLVAHTRVKTPTAAAEFLIAQVQEYEQYVMNMVDSLSYTIQNRRNEAEHSLQNQLFRLRAAYKTTILRQENWLNLKEKQAEMNDPQRILAQGYAFTTKNGKMVRSANELATNDIIETHFADGCVEAVVK